MKVFVKFYNKDGNPANVCRSEGDGLYSFTLFISIFQIQKFVKQYNVIRWNFVIRNRVITFFQFLGSQNDYLYPPKNCEHPEQYPFSKKHLWKTRIGFKTAYDLANIIHG